MTSRRRRGAGRRCLRGPALEIALFLLMSGCHARAPSRPPLPAERFPPSPSEPCTGVPLIASDAEARALPEGSVVALEGVPLPAALLGDAWTTGMRCSDELRTVEAYPGRGHEIRVPQKGASPFRVFLPFGFCHAVGCQTDCSPFGRDPKSTYRFVGTLVTPPWYFPMGTWQMDVARFCRVESNQTMRPQAEIDATGLPP